MQRFNNTTNTDEMSDNDMSQWIKTSCNLDDIKEGQMLSVSCSDKKILLANIHGKIFATDATCTHAEADLSTGFITPDGDGVRCPLHLSVFKFDDGTPQNPPAEQPLQTYNVKIEQNAIYVEV
jgi:nitrite reductase/ring-hydroxylating ferredoxin subunit